MVRKKVICLLLVPLLLLGALPVGALEKQDRLWQDETIYSIMIDRFHNGKSENDYDVNVQDLNGYTGGDFKGIQDKLDYIKEMGFTAISLSPIFDNEKNGYHGNWVKDFYQTDEHFGSIKEFKKLVKEAHKRKMKVIIDFPIKEVGPNHPWTKDKTKQEWFTKSPKLDVSNVDVQTYLLDVAKWWEKETKIDGYAFKQIQEIPESFWRALASEVRKANKDFFLVGEVDQASTEDSAIYQAMGFNSVMNMDMMKPAREVLGKVNSSFNKAIEKVEETNTYFRNPNQVAVALDNEETVRFTNDIVNNHHNPGSRWKLALTYTYTTPGIPFVFYGTEIALAGKEAPDNLQLMGFKADPQLIDFMKSLGNLRQTLPALTRGDYKLLYNENGMLVFKRTYKSEVIVVAINNSSKSQYVIFTKEELAENKELRGLLAGDLIREEDGTYKMVMKRETSEIYALAEKTGLNMGYIATILGIWVLFVVFIILVIRRSKRVKRS